VLYSISTHAKWALEAPFEKLRKTRNMFLVRCLGFDETHFPAR
jgi:hypothetical protein